MVAFTYPLVECIWGFAALCDSSVSVCIHFTPE